MKKAHIIAFYLPQYHPFPENDAWWGKGFTEWTNVGKAKPLFPGHYQPRVPADLGYYDLRVPEVREAQVELAKEAGIDAFCYWHYWFSGKQLLEKPLQEVVRLGKPDFPFCLAWANHSWEKRNWNADCNQLSLEVLIKQTYGGQREIEEHFYTMLPMFKDKRYYRVHGKLLFLFNQITKIPNDYLANFIACWQNLALKNNLPGFYFVAQIRKTNELTLPNAKYFDGFNYSNEVRLLGENKILRRFKRIISTFIHFPLCIHRFSSILPTFLNPICLQKNVYPVILSGFDHSPRSSTAACIITGFTPEVFYKHILQVLDLIKFKELDDRIIFLRSWNEWAECNYMEPDLKYGKKYIETLAKALK